MTILRKDFWKEFFAIFRESGWLIVRYLILGIYLIVTGIVANRLHLQELTYFNAVITLSYIGEMVSFGCSEGFGMFANLNIHADKNYGKYVKLGFIFSTLVSLVITILMFILSDFVLFAWLKLDFELDRTFYYMMLVAFFISAVSQYIACILKKLGLYKCQLYSTIIRCLLIMLGLILLAVSSVLALRLIAVVYLIGEAVTLVAGFFILLKNKEHPINVFAWKNLNIGKGEGKVIFYRSASELIFEVGYIFLSLFILRSDVILYNQYCYFENVLDIFNGVFFSFVSVVSIKICRAIGDSEKDKAYNYAMNCRWAVVFIWLGYAILSLALFYPIRLGLNPELRATAFIPMLLYLLLSLVRWSTWTRCTYIIGQSEIYAKHGIFWETGISIYYVLLYFIAPLLPASPYIIYGLIAVEALVQAICYEKIIKGKKWLDRMDYAVEDNSSSSVELGSDTRGS